MFRVKKQRKMSQNRTLGQRSEIVDEVVKKTYQEYGKCTTREHLRVAELILPCKKRISLNTKICIGNASRSHSICVQCQAREQVRVADLETKILSHFFIVDYKYFKSVIFYLISSKKTGAQHLRQFCYIFQGFLSTYSSW